MCVLSRLQGHTHCLYLLPVLPKSEEPGVDEGQVLLVPGVELGVLAFLVWQVTDHLAHPGKVHVVEGVQEDHQGATGYGPAFSTAYVSISFFQELVSETEVFPAVAEEAQDFSELLLCEAVGVEQVQIREGSLDLLQDSSSVDLVAAFRGFVPRLRPSPRA